MKKFKVGDRVRVRPDLVAGERYRQDGEKKALCLATVNMAELAGKVVTIADCIHPDRYRVVGSPCSWTDDMFVRPANANKIVVTTDGETTTARLFSGKELVRSATAKCSPRDEFVFETGAALVLARLLGQEKKAEPEAPKFTKADLKDGMFIRISDGSWGVIVGDLVVCNDGMFVFIHELREDLTWAVAGVIEVVLEGVNGFNEAMRIDLNSSCVRYVRPGVEK